MKRKVGIWIDHKKAVIVDLAVGDPKTLASDLEGHTRFSGNAGHSGADSAQGGSSEKKFEQRFRQQLDDYYDEVIAQLGDVEALLILGPGEAKLQLKERLGHSKAQPRPVIEVETADKLTDPQIVAKVKEHFRS